MILKISPSLPFNGDSYYYYLLNAMTYFYSYYLLRAMTYSYYLLSAMIITFSLRMHSFISCKYGMQKLKEVFPQYFLG